MNIAPISVFLISMLCSVTVLAQTDYNLPTLPSPAQASIAQYGEVPVNLQTGKINHSVPLHTVVYKDLSLPISLSYNVDGIRLESSVSWAGTGWDLMAGGSINRVKKGNPDEWSSGYYYTGDDTDFLNFINTTVDGSCTAVTGNSCGSGEYTKSSLGSTSDSEQDIFYFNIGGMSGKFVLEPGNTIAHTIPKSNTKIEVDLGSNSITKFTLTTPNGIIYTFGETSNTQEQVEHPTQDYTSTWFLNKVASPVGDQEIELVYGGGDMQTIYSYGFEAKYTKFLNWGKPDDIGYDDESATTYYYKKLSYIETPLEKIIFTRDTTGATTTTVASKSVPRERIDKIEVYSKGTQQNSKVIEFTHSITSEDRMYLDTLSFQNGSGNEQNRMFFEYHNKDLLPGDRSNMGIDMWGYFNNKHTYNVAKETYIPSKIIYVPSSNPSIFSGLLEDFEGANRNVNTSTVHYGALKKINYPTGGYTEIEYEPNDFSSVLYGEEYNGATFLSEYTSSIESMSDFVDTAYQVKKHPFTIDHLITSTPFTLLELDFKFLGDQCSSPLQVRIFKVEISANDIEIYWKPDVLVDYLGTFVIEENGDYYVETTASGTICQDPFSYDLDVTFTKEALVNKKYGPGIRVKKTTNHDGVSTVNDLIKTFEYGETINGEYISNGFIFQENEYYFEFPSSSGYVKFDYDETVGGNTISTHDNFWGLVSNPIANLGGDSRGFLGYNKIKVNIGEIVQGGYQEHFFDISKPNSQTNILAYDYENTAISNREVFPFGPDLSYRTSELQSFTYDSADVLIAKNSSRSKYHDGVGVNTAVQVKFPKVNMFTFRPESKLFSIGYNYSLLQRPELDSVVVYNGNGTPQITRTEYDYDDYGIQQLRKKTETNSLTSEQRVTTYTYAHEVYSGAGEMEDLNMLSQPYSVLIEDGSGADLSKSWTIWDEWATGQWLPQEQWVWEGTGTAPATPSSSAIKTTEILSYDSYGNPLEIQSGTGSNASVTKAFYGSNSQPFQNATTTGNAVNGVLGVYLTGIQKVNGTEDVITGGVRATSGDDLFSEASYDGIGRVISKTDENEQSMRYGYDSFNRLITQTNTNGLVVGATGYGYSASRNAGSFASDDPNTVMSIAYVDPFYATDFTTNDGWTGSLSKATFNYELNGEKVVRLGTPGGSTVNLKKNSGVSSLVLRTDVYISSSVTGTPPVVMFNNGNSSNNTKRRFGFEYITALDQFRINTRRYGETEYTYSDTLSLDAQPDRWYTIEIEKEGSTIKGWLYPRGGTRSEEYAVEAVGFSASWQPTVESIVGNNYIYISNFSMAKATQTSVSYLDGLGREIQTQVRGGGKVIATETLYNDRGLPEVAARPIETTATAFPGFYDDGLLSGGSTFIVGDTLPAASPVHAYYAPVVNQANDEDYAYAQTQYEASPLARVEKSTLPGTIHKMGSGNEVVTSYGLNTTESFTINGKSWGLNSLSKTVSKDPEGNETITYTNGWGQTIVSGVDMNSDGKLDRSTTDLVTEFGYDASGNLTYVKDPKGLETTYTYNTLGQLVEKELPDQDAANSYCYDDKGRLRFHRDPNHVVNVTYYSQAPQYDYHYIKYDDLDRPIETGEKNGLGSYTTACTPSLRNNQNYPSSYHTPKVYYSYDGTNAYFGAQNYAGRLTKVKYMEESTGPTWGETWYSYNSLGLVEWIVHSIPGLSGDIKITYDYDELGRQTRMGYNVTNASADHYFWYEYDELGRLEYVYSDTDSDEAGRIKEAEYASYTADGQVTQMKLGNANIQSVDYLYTVQGWLDKINNNQLNYTTDKFAMDLDYLLNGNISTQKWGQPEESITHPVQYEYTYDVANRLTAADYTNSNTSATDDDNNGYDVSYSYDKNGTMLNTIRKSAGYYAYPSNSLTSTTIESTSNRLTSYGVTSGPTSPVNYTVLYDANGNMTQNRFTSASYNERNLMTQVTKGGATVKFGYDADGNRIRKEMVSGVETHYVRGADGQTIAVYEDGALEFVNLLAGGQIIGSYDGSQRRYFLKDHLGTIRTTVDEMGAVDGYDDYYPFGLVMPGRSSNSANPNDNYKFTGYEKDDEAGLDVYFANARMYDPVINRFWQIDPLADMYPGWTPYHYVHNNPLNMTDPTGMSAIAVHLEYDKEGNEYVVLDPGDTIFDVIRFMDEHGIDGLQFEEGQEFIDENGYGIPGARAKTGRSFDINNFEPNIGYPPLPGGSVKDIKSYWKLITSSFKVFSYKNILRKAATGKGNFGLGSGTRQQAVDLGKKWVGKGYRVASDGKTLISKDGLRQFRPPSNKPRIGKTQANFESRSANQGRWENNGHLDIINP